MKKYQFKAFSTLTLANARQKLIDHAQKVGIYENFGQEVVSYLKDKYNYNAFSRESRDRENASKIDALEIWAMNYNG